MIKDLVGQRFGRLLVKEFGGVYKNRRYHWDCICDCGNTVRVVRDNLVNGHTQSCGCLSLELKTKHGKSKSRDYYIYHMMIQRCYNPKDSGYKWYGGRGVTVCGRWLESFENFYEDMGKRPKGMSLDRKDNDGNYEPSNCRWATKEEQHSNTRSNVWLNHDGERQTRTQWARDLGINQETLRYRLNQLGWSIKKALTTPVQTKNVNVINGL